MGGRLIEEVERSPACHRAGQADALLLSAGELRGLPARQLADTEPIQDLLCLRTGEVAAYAPAPERVCDCVQGRQVGPQPVVLKDQRDLPLFRRFR